MAFEKVVISGATVERYIYQFRNVGVRDYSSSVLGSSDDNGRDMGRFVSSIARSRIAIRRLISCNQSVWGARPLFCTFTFAANISSLSSANAHWKLFCRRFSSSLGYRLRYLTVVEFQKRGAVHYHSVFFNVPFSLNLKRDIAAAWGVGFVDVLPIRRIRSLGGYVSKYLQKGTLDARLIGEKAYFTSRGLKKPIVLGSTLKNPIIKSYPHPFIDEPSLGSYSLMRETEMQYSTSFLGLVKYSRYSIIPK